MVRSIRRLVFTSLLALSFALSFEATAQVSGAGQTSPTIETISGLEALARFNTTPEFLDDQAGDPSFRTSIAHQCEGSPVRQCIDYIQANRSAALAALPDNPEYWQALAQLLLGPTPEFDPTEVLYEDTLKNKHKLIEAVSEWGYRAIARDELGPATKQFVLNYRGIRRQMAQSLSLMDRMIFTALVGIAHVQVETLMALHSARGDLDSIGLLMANLTPYTKAESSMRTTLLGETQYVIAELSKATDLSPDDFPESAYVPTGSLEEIRRWALEISQHELASVQEYVRAITERSWDDYYQESFTDLAIDSDLPFDHPLFVSMSVYEDYIRTTRSSEVIIYPLLALGDIYLGRSSPGLPARLAPAHWQWAWQKKTNKVCLAPTHVAPGTTPFTVERPVCVVYQDGKGAQSRTD